MTDSSFHVVAMAQIGHSIGHESRYGIVQKKLLHWLSLPIFLG